MKTKHVERVDAFFQNVLPKCSSTHFFMVRCDKGGITSIQKHTPEFNRECPEWAEVVKKIT